MPSPLLSMLTLSLLFPFLLLLPVSTKSLDCVAVYREGGTPAVLKSSNCSRSSLIPSSAHFQQSSPGCHVANNQGRRRSQEDRAICKLSLGIPFLSFDRDGRKMRTKEVDVGIIAVFDGHKGAEASEMASNRLLEYFLLHTSFQLDSLYSVTVGELDGSLMFKDNVLFQNYGYINSNERTDGLLSTNSFDDSSHMEVLKESLVRAIHDIDLEFSKEALLNDIESGSTAAVVLIADGQILAVHVGDSKAFMCSEDYDKAENRVALEIKRRNRIKRRRSRFSNSEIAYNNGEIESRSQVKELTSDHHPDREDERRRVQVAGGFVTEWAGVARINGQLAVSRAIGDVSYKQYGVISTPEVTDWLPISSNDTFLVATSDGVFEKLTTQEACDILFQERVRLDMTQEGTSSTNMAEILLTRAIEAGTTDNVAAVVVPLWSEKEQKKY